MSLSPGTRLGPFEILSALGAGGMGEVYRAEDSKLRRDVALKILRPTVADDAEWLARFRREAQVLASLNHPNIAAIYGLEDSTGTLALVMELVEGPTLADRLARGPVPIDEALPAASQIAEALEAAHERGIVHRDLKPANIKVRPDGTVKVLDFGLAKALDRTAAETTQAPGATPGSGSGDERVAPSGFDDSPTVQSPAMTMRGVILGTAAYMSPEQAAGKAIDKRSDLWAFGVVLFEMLTGRRLFTGESVQHILAAVLKSEPDWTALPGDTPAPIRRLLRRCLEKDRKRRLDSAAAARLEIEEALARPNAAAEAPVRARRWPAAGLAVVAGVAAVAAVVTWILSRPAPADIPPSRFTIVTSRAQTLVSSPSNRDLALSPDGRLLVYRAGGTPAGGPLVVRAIDALEAQPLSGVTSGRGPFFSPDSRWVGFFEGGELKKIAIGGGTAVTLCSASGGSRGASWGDNRTIVFATGDPATGLQRVSEDGGEPTVLTTPDAARAEEDHLFPSVLPNGRGVLFTITAAGRPEQAQIAMLDPRSGTARTIVRGGSQPEYVESGHLIYVSAGALRAVGFDLTRLEAQGDPVAVVDDVMIAPNGAGNYAVSRAGTLVYAPAQMATQATPRSLVWVDRSGRETPLTAPPRSYGNPRLSPDRTRVVVAADGDLWIWDLARESLTRVTTDPALDQQPLWTPDSRRIVFGSSRGGEPNLYAQAADGTGAVERLTTSALPHVPTAIVPDGAHVIAYEITPKAARDVVLFPLRAGADARPTRLVQTAFDDWNADLSPNGRFIAYQSNESGRFEVYVRPFPQVDSGRWPISTSGGTTPVWAKHGRELFYLDAANAMTAVPMQTTGTFYAGRPAKLFDGAYVVAGGQRQYDVAADGQRFLMLKENASDDRAAVGMVVVLNWFSDLNRRFRRTVN